MPQEKLYETIQNIEVFIEESFNIFGNYIIVRKNELYNKFKLLYDNLPQELISNRDYLNSQKEENIFSLLRQVSIIIEKPKDYLGFILINKQNLIVIIDRIYMTLPEDIKICR